VWIQIAWFKSTLALFYLEKLNLMGLAIQQVIKVLKNIQGLDDWGS